MTIMIARERPDTPDAMALIAELEAHLNPLYPPESRHGLRVAALLSQGVEFFVARQEGQTAGCGGLLVVGQEYGEIKRMYVRPAFRGRGLGALILHCLEARAWEHDLRVLRLETGNVQHEARRLYERLGFQQIGPFGPYCPDPLSIFYEKRLHASPAVGELATPAPASGD